jgi:large subunit ribosomal protein L29
MRAEEIRELALDEIMSRVSELEEERFRLRFRGATETLEEPLRLRVIRREVARLRTILRERELGLALPAAAATKRAAPRGARAERKVSARGGRKN